ncbi:hypothetical protein, variant [Aphanomyces invadans]|uniref:RING-type E3 ubiquitin transferase n=1 Tax=Aphanomyces invadans TaxID=157072 RepID=A0A024TWJ4_9STRA|nr:hypothetical protein, variant [Aphanomyces invadans]ETV98525.1 hypothetical protein, variant [Aphanomyces invadans]|eukprot:XP_008872722.1 hypothetical protein, variant [Aphanomyces invadans]
MVRNFHFLVGSMATSRASTSVAVRGAAAPAQSQGTVNSNRSSTSKASHSRKKKPAQLVVPSATVEQSGILRPNAATFTPSLQHGASVIPTPDNAASKKQNPQQRSRRSRGTTEQPPIVVTGAPANNSDRTKDTTATANPATPLVHPSARGSRGGRNRKSRDAATLAKSTVVNEDDDERSESKEARELCLVCANPFRYHAIGECNHEGICSTCSMRMRLLMKDFNCPICKQANPRVIVTDVIAPYASFGIWGDTGGPGVLLDDRSEMFFSRCDAHYESLVRRRDLYCRRCPTANRVKFRVLEDLQLHMENEHATYFCDLCVQHQHFFVGEYPMYTMKELMHHQTSTVSATSRERHPLCEFCHVRYYSDVELHVHLERDHFKCHLCPEVQHRYYRNYKGLETHFRRQHLFCEDPSCIAKGFVVFSNDIDFQAHMFSVHGNQDNRIRIAFTVRRGMEDEGGASNVVSSGSNNDSWEFVGPPPSASRQQEEFPALPTAAPSATPWAKLAPVTPPAMIRPTAVAAPAPSSVPRAMLSRNALLASAFGRGPKTEDALEKELRPQYSQELKDWGRSKFRTLVAVEKKIEDMMADRACFSTHLKAMPREQVCLVSSIPRRSLREFLVGSTSSGV